MILELIFAAASLGATFSDNKPGAIATAGGEAWHGYVTYTEQTHTLVGQDLGDLKLYGTGIGVKVPIRPRLDITLRGGYYSVKLDTVDNIRDEAVVSHLNNNHGWRGSKNFQNTSYELEDTWGGSVGLSYKMNDYLQGTFEYRYIMVEGQMDAWTGTCNWPPTSQCQDWWQEQFTKDLSTVVLGIEYKF